MSLYGVDGLRQPLWKWTSNVVVAMGAAIVAIGLFVGVAAAKRAAACASVDCVADGIGQSARDTAIAIGAAGHALKAGARDFVQGTGRGLSETDGSLNGG